MMDLQVLTETERKSFEFVDFLKRNRLKIPDKDVFNVFKLKYDTKLSIMECSSLLSLLEHEDLLDKELSINKSKDFYTQKHKLFIDFNNEKFKV